MNKKIVKNKTIPFKINRIKVSSAIYNDWSMSGDEYESEGYVIVNNKKYAFECYPGDGLQIINIDKSTKFTDIQINKVDKKVYKEIERWYDENYDEDD